VFAEPGFKAFCERVVPYCNITTKVKGDKDQQLFRLKGGAAEDFPMVVFMDATGRVLYRVKGETLGDFEKGLAMLDEIAALQRKVAAGDRSAPLPLLLKQLELHHIDFPAAKKAVKKIPQLTKAQKRELAPYLLESEVFYLAGQGAASDKALAKTGERFFRMKQKGEIPTRDARLPFWKCIMVYAHQREKVDLYEEALDTLKQEYPDMKFPAQERILLELRDKQGDP
jgi:hypothetical protein